MAWRPSASGTPRAEVATTVTLTLPSRGWSVGGRCTDLGRGEVGDSLRLVATMVKEGEGGPSVSRHTSPLSRKDGLGDGGVEA